MSTRHPCVVEQFFKTSLNHARWIWFCQFISQTQSRSQKLFIFTARDVPRCITARLLHLEYGQFEDCLAYYECLPLTIIRLSTAIMTPCTIIRYHHTYPMSQEGDSNAPNTQWFRVAGTSARSPWKWWIRIIPNNVYRIWVSQKGVMRVWKRNDWSTWFRMLPGLRTFSTKSLLERYLLRYLTPWPMLLGRCMRGTLWVKGSRSISRVHCGSIHLHAWFLLPLAVEKKCETCTE